MLSPHEYEDTIWKLENLPETLTGKRRQHCRRLLKKKIQEHLYASTYEPFEPLPHVKHFLNRTTSEESIEKIIELATRTSIFTLDTESTQVYRSPNNPVLIQLQIIPPNDISLVLLIEMCHLPPKHQRSFELIQQLFERVMDSQKTIYIWGTNEELFPFEIYGTFNRRQVEQLSYINLQQLFKQHWQTVHQHEQGTSCLCENCIGQSPTTLWSLQSAVAWQLHRWLDKRVTSSPFHIGLDPKLAQLNQLELDYRGRLSTYASNDCLSMQSLMISMGLNIGQDWTITSNENSPIEQHHIGEIRDNAEEGNQELNIHIEDEHSLMAIEDEHPLTTINDETLRTNEKTIRTIENNQTVRTELTEAQKKKIHNRTCTLKQRRRYYQHEIIINNIDTRLTIRRIKAILRSHQIDFFAVNTSTTSKKGRNLFIGIRNPELLHDYEQRIRNLFHRRHAAKLKREDRSR